MVLFSWILIRQKYLEEWVMIVTVLTEKDDDWMNWEAVQCQWAGSLGCLLVEWGISEHIPFKAFELDGENTAS